MAFKEDLKTKSAYIEDLLKQYMPKEEGYQKTIFDAMNYSLSSGGKRLRDDTYLFFNSWWPSSYG